MEVDGAAAAAAAADDDRAMDAEPHPSRPLSKEETVATIRAYFFQLTKGCADAYCRKRYCATASKSILAPNKAAAVAVQATTELGREGICPPPHLTAAVMLQLKDAGKEAASKYLYSVFSSEESLAASFPSPVGPLHLSTQDMADAYATLAELAEAAQSVRAAVGNAIDMLTQSLLYKVNSSSSAWSKSPACAKVLITLLEVPLLRELDSYAVLFPAVVHMASQLHEETRQLMAEYWAGCDAARFQALVSSHHQFVTIRILQLAAENEQYSANEDRAVGDAVKTLAILHDANSISGLIAETEFQNDAINDNFDYGADFTEWKKLRRRGSLRRSEAMTFCHYPWVLSTSTKSHILNIENRIQQRQEQEANIFEMMLRREPMYLKITIHRQAIIRDAMTQISSVKLSHPEYLKKPLRVVFRGEEGIDEGGVQKEFFQLCIRDLFDPNYGMFQYDDETRLFWFNKHSLETPAEFGLLGTILGLALYNNVILDLHFPSCVYKKLMDEAVGLEDLKEINPSLAQGLQALLKYNGDDVATVFPYTFEIDYEDMLGTKHTHLLKEGGGDIELSHENKAEFVRLYVDWALNVSIAEPFGAFKDGFRAVVAGSEALSLFLTSEIELLLCGTQDLDFDQLQRVTIYDGGYEADTQAIVWFWEVAKALDDEGKKKLLFFATGTDRVPVGGLEHMRFIIAKQPDSDRLPSSHTCFNVLLLPEYDSKDKLAELLGRALQNAEGFGML